MTAASRHAEWVTPRTERAIRRQSRTIMLGGRHWHIDLHRYFNTTSVRGMMFMGGNVRLGRLMVHVKWDQEWRPDDVDVDAYPPIVPAWFERDWSIEWRWHLRGRWRTVHLAIRGGRAYDHEVRP